MAGITIPSIGIEGKVTGRSGGALIRGIGVFGAMVFGVHCISLSTSGLTHFHR